MEISPIAGVRVLPVAKTRPVDPELTALFDIEAAVRPDDDTFSRNGQKAAGAEEPEEEEEGEDLSEEAADAADGEIDSGAPAEVPAGQISFFA